jgi:hypothetical protein
MASAFPSKGVVYPAARLAVRGLDVVALGPSSEVRGRVAVPVNRKAAAVASVGSLCQPHGSLDCAASHAGGSRREPAVAEDQFASSPFDLVTKLATELCPGGVTNRSSDMSALDKVGDGEVLKGQPAVGLSKVTGHLVEEVLPYSSDPGVLSREALDGRSSISRARLGS